jgi:hypothetical protein
MKIEPIQLIQTKTAASDVNSVAYDLQDAFRYSVQMTLSGSDVAGTAKIQCSNDGTTWFDVANSSQSITNSSDYLWSYVDAAYRYMRFFWDYTSGTGNITVLLIVKENVVVFP